MTVVRQVKKNTDILFCVCSRILMFAEMDLETDGCLGQLLHEHPEPATKRPRDSFYDQDWLTMLPGESPTTVLRVN